MLHSSARARASDRPVTGSANVAEQPASDALVLTGSVQDYFHDEDEFLPEGVQAPVQLGDPSHYRLEMSAPHGHGYAEFCGLADGFFVHLSDLAMAVPNRMQLSAPDFMRLRIASDGDCSYTSSRGEQLAVQGAGALVIVEPAGMPAAQALVGGRNRGVHVYIHREALRQRYEGCEQQLPGVLQAFLAGTLQHTLVRGLPLEAGLLQCLEDLQCCRLKGRQRRHFFEAKAIEMLCHAIDSLARQEGRTPLETSLPMAQAVVRAQRLLMDNFVAPPSLEDLAREVGLSRSGLCAGFRQVLGQTVFEYVNDLRMQRALALLGQRDASITQIAYEVGYNHSSSFTVAVQRRFGVSPSQLRKRGLPIL